MAYVCIIALNRFAIGGSLESIWESISKGTVNAGYLDMRNVREGGCSAAQEIAFGVACAMAGSDALIEKGLDIEDFLHRVTWFVNAGPELFEEVAKFRAMRRVWAKIFRERYGAQKPQSLMCRMHCQIYAPTLTMQQPFNNLIRGSIYALGAILGGVQSLQVLQEHADFEVLHEYSPDVAEKQIARLQKVRAERDPEQLALARTKLINTMQAEKNMIAPLIEAVRSGLTRGEFGQIKSEVFNQPGSGPYVCSPPFVLA